MAFQLYRGTDAQVAAYTGADGELVYNMTNHSLHINDGVTPGGFVFKTAEDMKTELLAGASAAYDTLKEIEDYINSNEGNVGTILTNMNNMQNNISNLQNDMTNTQNELNQLRADFDALKLAVTTDANGSTYSFGS